MFWKDVLASEILAKGHCDYQWLIDLGVDFPQLRVKTVDASRKVPVIRFDEKSEWQKPEEWAMNHFASIRQKFWELHSRMVSLGCDPATLTSNGASASRAESNAGSDPSEVTKLKQQNQRLITNYCWAMQCLKLLHSGEILMLEDTQRIDAYNPEKPTYVI